MERKEKSAAVSVPMAVDGGWGWMVLLGSFVAYFIADGWSYSFGLLFPELLAYFEESKGKTALIGAFLYGVPLLLSPIVCALTNVYGCRVVAVVGGFLTALSLVISSFASSVAFLCVSTGMLASLGLAMTYIPSLVIVSFYFEKRRGLATGLAVTGSGLGTIAFPPMMELLFNTYTWRGALFITGGVCLHIIASGALFRPPPVCLKGGEVEPETKDQGEATCALTSSCTAIANDRAEPVAVTEDSHSTEGKGSVSCPDLYVEIHPAKQADTPSKPHRGTTCCQGFWRELRLLMSAMLDKSLTRSWGYLLFCASSFVLYLWVGVPYIYLIDRAITKDIAGDLMFLASIMGMGRTVGQVFLGFLGDHTKINAHILYAVSIVIAGIATLLVPVCNGYPSLTVYSVVFGFFISVTYALQFMCVVNIVGLERSTNAFGFLQLVQGIATLLGTPVAGWLYDAFGDYDASFYVAGAWIAVSGAILIPLKWHSRT